MTILAIIGFVVILFFALYMSVVTISVWFGEVAFSGKTSAFTYVFLTITCTLWFGVYVLFPFKITIGV